MIDNQERRASGATRVPVEALVEICGNDPGIPAFEAEALDVSGQGMHLRTAYLPERGAPLVCRFEDRGREIVVEGEVAWRNEQARGGEFGIRFTALDSGSVEALKDLCDSRSESPPPAQADGSPLSPPASEAGSRVRLHIDGLGSPMKARVRDSGARQVQVGSNLEFLKVGRRLEIEDLEFNEKRRAHIDSVNVVIDPQSQVPQLVVALRYDDLPEVTPEPSVIDTEVHPPSRGEAPEMASIEAGSASTSGGLPENTPAPAAEDEVLEEVGALRNRFDVAAVRAGAVAKSTGVVLARASASAAQGMGKLLQGASAKVLEFKKKRAAAGQPRRTTAAPPSGVLSAAGQRLRPQSSAALGETPEDARLQRKARVKRIAITASLAVFLAAVSALALHHSAPPGAASAATHAAAAHAVQQAPKPVAAATAAPAPAHKGTPSANVPLFGPTPMATLEPAPLGPAPQPSASASAAAPNAEEAAELAAAKAAPAVADQVFVDDQPPASQTHKAKKAIRPKDVRPWGHGSVHMPTVYKLRLDKPGTAIEGAVRPTGFTVLIPGRKVHGSTRAIVRRDRRIARVTEENTHHGAQISFRFRDAVPGYRVRLRHHYVEFLISAPRHHAKHLSRRKVHHARSKRRHGRRHGRR